MGKTVRRTVFLPCATALVLILLIVQTSADRHNQMANKEEFAQSSEAFATKLFQQLVAEKPNSNIIFSPFSIQMCMGMARIGATGETAAELDSVLGFPANSDAAVIGDAFNGILATYQNSKILKIANKIYISTFYEMKPSYNEIVTKQFFSGAEQINFEKSQAAASVINNWVESKTNNLIKNLISPDALDSDTRAVLVNAIHFKGEWQHQFPKEATKERDFYLNEADTVKVPMMGLKEKFLYGTLPDLDATALEMPYKDSNLSMLVILPNSRTGLSALQEKLRSVPLSDITSHMSKQTVIVQFPKFKAEFSIELVETLKKIGLQRTLSDQSEFDNMLSNTGNLQISQVVHKAFIEVNEEGTEAAAATAAVVRKKRSLLINAPDPIRFIADRPFLYLIKSSKSFGNDDGTEAAPPISLFIGIVQSVEAAPAAPKHVEL